MSDASMRRARRRAQSRPAVATTPLQAVAPFAMVVAAFEVVGLLLVLDATWGPSPATAATAVAVAVVLCVLLYRFEPLFFVLFFLFALGQIGAAVSGLVIESGAYVSEEARFGIATGATVRLTFYFLLLLVAALFAFTALKPRMRRSLRIDRHRIASISRLGIFVIAIAVLTYLYAGIAVNGSPLFEHIDRFSYWRDNRLPLLQPVNNQLSAVVFILGLVLTGRRPRRERVLVVALYVLSLAYFVLQGEKFTALVLVSYSFFLPLLVHGFGRLGLKASIPRAFWVSLMAVSILGGLVLYRYASTSSSVPPVQSLQRRIALQGHVWWGVDLHYWDGTLPVPPSIQRWRELKALVTPSGPGTQSVGMTLLMRTIASRRLVDGYLRHGVRFTMGYPAIGLYLFGASGLVVLQLVAGVVVALLAMYVVQAILAARVLRAFVGYKLFFLVYDILTVGNFYELFSYKSLTYVVLAFSVEVLISMSRKGRLRYRVASWDA